MLAQFPGVLGSCLELLREQQFSSIPTVTQLIEQEEDGSIHIFESILQIMLSYVKYGEIKYGDEPLSDERVQVVFKLLPELDSAITNPSGKERWNVVNLILVRCWDYIEEFMEICKQRQEDATAAGAPSSIAQTLSEMLQSIAGGSAAGEGTSTPVAEAGSPCPASNATKRAKTSAQAKESESEEEKAKNPLLPRLSQKMLNRKPLKVSLTELAEVKKALLRILCLPTVHQVTKVSRMCRQRKPAASHISTQSRYQSRWAVPLNETMHMSVSTMTVLRLMLNACWKNGRESGL